MFKENLLRLQGILQGNVDFLPMSTIARKQIFVKVSVFGASSMYKQYESLWTRRKILLPNRGNERHSDKAQGNIFLVTKEAPFYWLKCNLHFQPLSCVTTYKINCNGQHKKCTEEQKQVTLERNKRL